MTRILPSLLLLTITAVAQPMIPQSTTYGPVQTYWLPGFGIEHVRTATQPDGTVTADGKIFTSDGTYTLHETIIINAVGEVEGFECHDYVFSPPTPPAVYALTFTPGISEMSTDLVAWAIMPDSVAAEGRLFAKQPVLDVLTAGAQTILFTNAILFSSDLASGFQVLNPAFFKSATLTRQ